MISEDHAIQLANQLRDNMQEKGITIEEPPESAIQLFNMEVVRLIRFVEEECAKTVEHIPQLGGNNTVLLGLVAQAIRGNL